VAFIKALAIQVCLFLLERKSIMSQSKNIFQALVALIAALFGLVTVFAGGRVLAGADPGYRVFLPLLVFNTVMGVIYVMAGLVTWRSIERGTHLAATIFGLNRLVLGAIGYLYATGSVVAVDSLRAMSLRTFVWLMLFLVLGWINHQSRKDHRAI
jgi:hypothetical protein